MLELVDAPTLVGTQIAVLFERFDDRRMSEQSRLINDDELQIRFGEGRHHGEDGCVGRRRVSHQRLLHVVRQIPCFKERENVLGGTHLFQNADE